MLLRILAVLVLWCLLVCRLRAQDLNDNNFIRYTRQDGLSNNYITGIVQDASGYIWVATRKGLNRFDGNVFKPVFKNSPHSPLPDNLLTGIHWLSNNEMAGVTENGGFAYDPTLGRCKKFIVPCQPSICFWTNQGYDITNDKKGNYILSTKTGLYIFNAAAQLIKRYDYYQPSDAGKTELIFGGWVHTLTNGLVFQQNHLLGSVYNPGTNTIDTLYVQKNRLLKNWLSNEQGEITISYAGRRNELFIPDFKRNGINVADLGTMKTRFNPMPFSLPAEVEWHRPVFYINDSLLAMPCKIGGFYLLQYNAQTSRLWCNNQKHFEGKLCTSIFKDRDGRLWIGTNDGLYKQNLRNTFFSDDDLSLQYPALLNHGIRSIYIDGNDLYTGLGNNGGLLICNRNTKKIVRHIDFREYGPAGNTIPDIFPYSKDTLWLGTGSGILWLNKHNYHYGRIDMSSGAPWANKENTLCFLEDSKKDIWISFGCYNSVLCYHRATGRFSTITAEKYPRLKVTYVFSMAEDNSGNIWLAGDGLCRWNRNTHSIDTLIPYPAVTQPQRNYMLITGHDQQDNLWLSSFDNTILQYNCSTHSMYLREQDNNWLDGNTVTSSPIIHNNIWLGTDNGISAFNILTHTVTQFTYGNGLPSVAITTLRRRSFYDSTRNRFYLGAGPHLISFIPDVLGKKEIAPRLLIDQIATRDTLIGFNNQPVKLRYFQNDITFTFNAINFTDPEENRFAWRLAHATGSGWQLLEHQNSITLTNLAPGTYRLEVKLFSANNHWPLQTQFVEFFIKPPFWATRWFIITLSFVTIVVIYITGRWRINAIRKKEREKALVQKELTSINQQLAEAQLLALQTQMNPHFIFNALNSIKRMILDGDNGNGSRYLSKFAFMIRLTLDHSKRGFISLQETIEYLSIYLEMEQLRFGDSFTYTIETTGPIDLYETVIPSLMIQPLVENAIWHGLMPKAGRKQLSIHFMQQDDKIICHIEDNGIGIRQAEIQKRVNRPTHQSTGLENLRRRIKIIEEKYKMDFIFEINDLSEMRVNESGTLVVLSFKAINH